jgi:hypothetical protein
MLETWSRFWISYGFYVFSPMFLFLVCSFYFLIDYFYLVESDTRL